MATFSCFMLQMKLFDWLRLFDSTAPLIMLLSQAIEDIYVFIFITFVSILLFSIPIFILTMNWITSADDSGSLLEDKFYS